MVWVRGVTSAWVMSATLWVLTLWVMSVAMRAVMQISLPQPRPRWETLTATTRKCKRKEMQNHKIMRISILQARQLGGLGDSKGKNVSNKHKENLKMGKQGTKYITILGSSNQCLFFVFSLYRNHLEHKYGRVMFVILCLYD